MTALIGHTIHPGETLYIEGRVRDEDGVYDILDNVTLTVVTDLANVTVEKTAEVGGFEVKALKAATALYEDGIFPIKVFAEYPPTDDIPDELLLIIQNQVETV